MSLARYVKATIPDRVVIMGIVLNDFSAGHYLLLSRLGSPFIADAVETKQPGIIRDDEFMAHFILAIVICSHSYEDNLELFRDSTLLQAERDRINKQMVKSIRKEKKKYGFNLFEKFALFREYLKDGFKVPPWSFNNSDPEASSKVPSRHWSEQLIEDLVSKGNRTRSEVLNLHLSAAWEAWAHIAEDNGAITLLTEEQEKSIQNKEQSISIEDGGWEKLLARYEATHGKVT